MISAPEAPCAPRSRGRAGALSRFGVLGALSLLPSIWAPPAEGQVPDSLQAPDSLGAPTQVLPPDSLMIADSLRALGDSTAADTIFHNLPDLSTPVSPGFATGVWEWTRQEIMASGANTLAELVNDVPGLIALYGGDYGTPLALTAFGQGGGGYRVYLDGFEIFPLDGGVPDLQRVALVGIRRVRLDRRLGAMTIEMWSHSYDDGRPFSIIEAGTGDLDTNTFRGVFADPTALGGSIAFGLERADTRGRGPDEAGSRTGTWARYQLHLRDRAGLAFDFRRMGTKTEVAGYAPALTRTDLVVRGRVEPIDGVVAEAYTGRSSLDAEDAGEAYMEYGGRREQHGARLAIRAGDLWGRGSMRLFRGRLPSRDYDASAGFQRPELGGVSGGFTRTEWSDVTTNSLRARGWLGPFLGATVFGAYEDGTFGARDGPVLDGLMATAPPRLPQPTDTPPGTAVVDRSTLRGGAALSAFGATLSGAALVVESDLHLPLATEPDYGAEAVTGLRRTGVEAWTSIPMPLEGLRLEGSYQRWSEEGPYLPHEIYRGSFEYHRVHMDSGNLELWWSLGVRGHDPMLVFVQPDVEEPEEAELEGGLQRLPFYQNWYFTIQVRIVTVRLFLGWDNFTLRRRLQTFPDRLLPVNRTFFALRWDMWN